MKLGLDDDPDSKATTVADGLRETKLLGGRAASDMGIICADVRNDRSPTTNGVVSKNVAAVWVRLKIILAARSQGSTQTHTHN